MTRGNEKKEPVAAVSTCNVIDEVRLLITVHNLTSDRPHQTRNTTYLPDDLGVTLDRCYLQWMLSEIELFTTTPR
jgi:hypothetical protein